MSGSAPFLTDIEKGKDLKKTTTAEKNALPTKEEIAAEKIELSNGRSMVQYREQLMPLVQMAGVTVRTSGTQPILVFAATAEDLRRAHRISGEKGLTCAAYVRAMFSTGHDAANREVFRAEPADAPDLVGIALRGPKKDVDKAVKGAKLHP